MPIFYKLICFYFAGLYDASSKSSQANMACSHTRECVVPIWDGNARQCDQSYRCGSGFMAKIYEFPKVAKSARTPYVVAAQWLVDNSIRNLLHVIKPH